MTLAFGGGEAGVPTVSYFCYVIGAGGEGSLQSRVVHPQKEARSTGRHQHPASVRVAIATTCNNMQQQHATCNKYKISNNGMKVSVPYGFSYSAEVSEAIESIPYNIEGAWPP